MRSDELQVGTGTEAVPAARRFVVSRLEQWGEIGDVVDAAALVATELVTNAVLHAGISVRLTVTIAAEVVRLEVHDGSQTSPVPAAGDQEGMTGRGLALVTTMSTKWGVEASGGGKVVWAELSRSPEEAPALAEGVDPLAAFADLDLDLDPDGGTSPGHWQGHDARLYTVELGDVPTELLLAAKSHVDSLARELSLASSGSYTGVTPQVPPHLSALIDAVVTEFYDARHDMQRQAVEAAAKGQDRTHLSLRLPIEAADAAERYSAALEELDAYARAARLLSLETPPEHQTFRRWYIPSLVQALRHAAHGESPVVPMTFEAYLLDQVVHLAEPWRISERAARLQRAAAALAAAATEAEVGFVAVREAMAEVRAARGALIVASDHPVDPVHLVAGLGEGASDAPTRFDRGAPLPSMAALDTGQPVWLVSREECEARFPEMVTREPDVVAACAVPCGGTGATKGIVRLSFTTTPRFDQDERRFLQALASITGQAFERVTLRRANAELRSRLEQVTGG